MVTRVLSRGQVIWANEVIYPPRATINLEKAMVEPDEAEPTELRGGDVWYDQDEQVHYRVIGSTPAVEGWATSPFWLKRYEIALSTLLRMVQRGLIDAAMERGSPTKRYRVRSDEKARAWLKSLKQHRADHKARRRPDHG